jgi:xanthine dehydrogenase accessory factor
VRGSPEELDWVAGAELRGPGFAESADPPPRLIAVGAVPLAAALTRLAGAAGWSSFVIDPRSRFATPQRFPDAEVIVGWPREGFAQAGGIESSTAIVVLAHDPVLDDPALEIALRSSAVYIGAMGSRRTQIARRERLGTAGLSETELDRLAGPAGLELGAKTAGDTALSILAEIVAVAHDRSGGRLTTSGGPIHTEAA